MTEILMRIHELRLVPVVVIEDAGKAERLAKALPEDKRFTSMRK